MYMIFQEILAILRPTTMKIENLIQKQYNSIK